MNTRSFPICHQIKMNYHSSNFMDQYFSEILIKHSYFHFRECLVTMLLSTYPRTFEQNNKYSAIMTPCQSNFILKFNRHWFLSYSRLFIPCNSINSKSSLFYVRKVLCHHTMYQHWLCILIQPCCSQGVKCLSALVNKFTEIGDNTQSIKAPISIPLHFLYVISGP